MRPSYFGYPASGQGSFLPGSDDLCLCFVRVEGWISCISVCLFFFELFCCFCFMFLVFCVRRPVGAWRAGCCQLAMNLGGCQTCQPNLGTLRGANNNSNNNTVIIILIILIILLLITLIIIIIIILIMLILLIIILIIIITKPWHLVGSQ